MGTTGTWTGSGVQVNGGTLLLGASGQLPSAGTMSMSGGGTLSLGGAGTTTARFAESTGALTLTGNSVIDFGSLSQTGTASLTFWPEPRTELLYEATEITCKGDVYLQAFCTVLI